MRLSLALALVLTKSPNGGYHWNLKSRNGQVIATSEHYQSKRAALGGIESVRKHAAEAVVETTAESEPPRAVFGVHNPTARCGRRTSL